MLPGQIADPALPAFFLIGDRKQHQVALERQLEAPDQYHHEQLHHRHALHIERTTTPNLAVDQFPRKRVDAPVLGFGGNHVDVRKQYDRPQVTRFKGPKSCSNRDAFGSRLVQSRFDIRLSEPFAQEFRTGAFASRRVRRVDADVLSKKFGRLITNQAPIDVERATVHGPAS